MRPMHVWCKIDSKFGGNFTHQFNTATKNCNVSTTNATCDLSIPMLGVQYHINVTSKSNVCLNHEHGRNCTTPHALRATANVGTSGVVTVTP